MCGLSNNMYKQDYTGLLLVKFAYNYGFESRRIFLCNIVYLLEGFFSPVTGFNTAMLSYNVVSLLLQLCLMLGPCPFDTLS